MAGFLLGVLLLLNLAAVLPALHDLWHDGHGCDEPDCVVVAFAQGKVDLGLVSATVPVPAEVSLAVPALPVTRWTERGDCPPLPGRAPPV